MCSSQTLELIHEVVDEKVDADEAFTAFDISLEVKSRLKEKGLPVERHRHMKGPIHNYVRRKYLTIYEQKLHDVGAGSPAILYYPDGYDPDNYVPVTRHAPNASNAPQKQWENPTSPDSRGTLCVPNRFLKAAGFHPSETAYVAGDSGKIVLCKRISSGQTRLSEYTVDRSTNVRITNYTLGLVGLGRCREFGFSVSGDQVLVKPCE